MNSLRWRICLGLVLSLALVVAVQWLVARVAVAAMMQSFVERELVEDTDELFEALRIQPGTAAGGPVVVTLDHVDPSFSAPDSGHYFQIMVGGRKAMVSRSLADGDLNTSALAPMQSELGRVAGPGGQPMLFGSKGFAKDEHEVTIEIGMGLAQVDSKVDQMMWQLGVVSAAMMALLLALQYGIVHRELGVLRRVQGEVERVSSGEIQTLDETVPREVLPLVKEINKLSLTLNMRLQRSRHALGNLAHALKTPLSLLAQTAMEAEAPAQAQHSMLDHLGVLRKRIDLELKRARLAGPSSASASFELAAAVGPLADAMRKLYRAHALELRIDGLRQVLWLHADREDMLELLGNLLDNACKFARREVRLTMGIQDGLSILVEDDGPGCDDADLASLTLRGVRIDERPEGHGLGLAIIQDIVTSYGGTLKLGRSVQLGGFSVAVLLPSSLLVPRLPAKPALI